MPVTRLMIVFLALTTTVAALPLNGGTPEDLAAIGLPEPPEVTQIDPPEINQADPPTPSGFDSPIPNPMVGTKPLLVVLMEFTDLAHNAAVTPAFIQGQFFGARPSVNDFYLEQSYGLYSFSDKGHWAWITAYNDPGTSVDEATWAYWSTAPDPTYGGGTFHRWGLKSLDIAGYNFAPLDVDSDGTLEFGPEIAYIIINAAPVAARGGAMRGMPPGLTLDGKTVNGVSCGVPADSPWITLYSHELAHQSSWGHWFLTDYYGIIPEIVGYFSLMGYSGTGGWAGPIGPHHLDPLSKLKAGWYTPTVVTTDGFRDIDDAETGPVAFLLHEPAHGKDEYFLVENRWKGTSYDNTDALIGAMVAPLPPANAAIDIPDEGILIWHVDETRDWNGSSTGGFAKIDLMRRGGSESNAAFNGADAGYYDFWDGSSTENAKWNGGANSKTGVWCVSPAGATMRAFLDVPGPGVLICTTPLSTSAIPGSAGSISVPVRNTGDVADTYSITVSTPSDVVATVTSPVTIPAKTQTMVTVQLTPVRACTTTPGPRAVTITTTSTINPGVSGSTPATLNVLSFGEPQASIITIDGDVEPGNTATYTVSIVNDGNSLDTFSLSFTAIDFGTAYLADPTAIQLSWVSFSPTGPSAPACGTATSTLSIVVPWDWAGMEDATYDFDVTATSAVTPSASDTASGQLIVRATPLSMMFYVKVELKKLILDVEALPPSGARDGLHAKATSALAKVEQGIDRYLAGDDPPASNHFETTQNKLGAFLNQIEAQRGKGLTNAQADDLAAKAQLIIDHIDAILLLI